MTGNNKISLEKDNIEKVVRNYEKLRHITGYVRFYVVMYGSMNGSMFWFLGLDGSHFLRTSD